MKERGAVADYFSNKIIFLTGGSGFIGKVLIWKLLQSCQNLDTIYMLIRKKRGKDVQTRIDEILQAPIFDNFKKENPQILTKVKAVAGDIGEDRLGLSDQDERKLIESVHIVFHVGATVNMNASLKDAININTTGTLRLLKLAENMPKLEAFIHTSTAYCHCDVPVMEEKIYTPRENPYQMIELVKWMKPEVLDSISDRLIKPHPNSYTYSKNLTEHVVADYYPKLPLAIARSSIVIPSWHEPFPGWIDNLNGPTGLLTAGAKGVLRTMWCKGDNNADIVPVDVICNSLITVAWKIGTDIKNEKSKEIPVYHLTRLEGKPLNWRDVVEVGRRLFHLYPFTTILWYPGGDMHSNYYVHTLFDILFHWIPAYFVDGVLFLFRRKRFLVRIQQKVHQGLEVLQYFTLRQWNFVSNNLLELREMLTAEDKKIFILTSKNLNRDEFFINSMIVTRRYIFKEDPENVPRAKTKLKIMYYLDRFVKLSFWFFVAWMFIQFVDVIFGVNRQGMFKA